MLCNLPTNRPRSHCSELEISSRRVSSCKSQKLAASRSAHGSVRRERPWREPILGSSVLPVLILLCADVVLRAAAATGRAAVLTPAL